MNYSYYPKRPIRSFQDLEVYQKTYALAIKTIKKIKDEISEKTKNNKTMILAIETNQTITRNIIETVLAIPKLIASAHSLRFGDPEKAISTLEKCMLSCNMAILYLEEFRDIVNQKIEAEYFEEQIKEYLRIRGKIMRLQRSWLKFMSQRKQNGKIKQ